MSGHASLDQPRSLACFSLSASSLNAAEGTSFAFDKKIAAGLRVPGNRQLPYEYERNGTANLFMLQQADQLLTYCLP